MPSTEGASYVAECFWPGVQRDDLCGLDHRIEESAAEHGERVRYLGSMLIIDDEVVLCLFEGSIEAVRQVLERGGIPFERILQTAASRRPQQSGDPLAQHVETHHDKEP
jgi:hypothetical protein